MSKSTKNFFINLANYYSARLKKVTQVLCLILVFLLSVLAIIFHQTVEIRVTTAATLTSFNLGKRSATRTEENLYQGSSLKTFYTQLPTTKCNESNFGLESNSNEFWLPVSDKFKTYVRSKAYLDVRLTDNEGNKYKTIKAFIMSQMKNASSAIYCSYMGTEKEIISVMSILKEIWMPFWDRNSAPGMYYSYLVECPLPLGLDSIPSHVYISDDSCGATTTLTVESKGLQKYYENGGKPFKGFCLCVKPLDFPWDISAWIVEWIESNKILGASKIVIYTYQMHPNVERALNFYQDTGLVELKTWFLPDELPNEPEERRNFLVKNTWIKRRSEVLPYNECFYQNMYKFKFVLPIDIDEIIFPIKFSNWSGLLDYVYEKDPFAESNVASFSVRNAQFFKKWSLTSNAIRPKVFNDTLVTTSVIMRSENLSKPGYSVKSFVNTQVANYIFNHYAIGVLRQGQLKNLHLSPELVQMNHYKEGCDKSMKKECKNNFLKFKVEDKRFAEKYGGTLTERVQHVLKFLNP